MTIDKKQMLIDLMSHQDYKPMKIKGLTTLLELDKAGRRELDTMLEQLILEGKVIFTKRGKYMLNDTPTGLVGKFSAHEKGFGFVTVEGFEEDIFIPGKYVGTAFHQDIVAIELLPESRGRRQEGRIIEVVERSRDTVVGLYQPASGFGFVVTDDKKISKDIYIPISGTNNAMKDHKVVVRIVDWGSEDKNPQGEIIEIIGHKDDPDTEIMSIVKSMGIPSEFPEAVKKEVATIEKSVSAEEGEGRLDIRNLQTVTIDGADAKDLDDAITIEPLGQGYRLGVHIADVTHYVKEGSALDVEALERSTSVYLVDRVIPMLPRQLSNGICSLNAGEDRLALSCIMDVNEDGEVVDYKIAETLIHVDERMTYKDVAAIITDEDPELMARYNNFVGMFKDMEKLATILRKKRKARGSIDFNFPEAKVILDEFGQPIDIYLYDRNVATKLIEEFMLLANEVVAEHHFWQEIPFVYRNHDIPDKDRLKALSRFIYNFGYHIKGKEDVHPKAIQKLLVDIEGSSEEILISRLALRSMKQARYEAECLGHFGLAAKYYTHFTSPIRRYPDLQIHRIIKQMANGKMDAAAIKHYKHILPDVTKQASEYERRAEQAERETIKLKKVVYMSKHLGETFEGVISSVTKWGMYIELPNTIEGLVHVSSMVDDHYVLDEANYLFVGERTRKVYSLGDRVHVEVVACNKDERNIDFKLIDLIPDEESTSKA